MRLLAQRIAWFSASWKQETPMRLHTSAISEDGSPQWHPDFVKWMSDDDINRRTKKVFRRLRRKSVREYEVCYRVLVLGDRVDNTTDWLNERAERNDIPFPKHRPNGPHYVRKDTLALLIAGLSFAQQNW